MAVFSYSFGEFNLDTARYELRRNGQVLKLERIPMELLILLAEKRGIVVARQEIVDRLWGKDVFVDTEHGINTAIRKIRQALKDDPEDPHFVQTVTGKGYRFVAETNGTSNSSAVVAEAKPYAVNTEAAAMYPSIAPAAKPRRRQTAAIVILAVGLAVAGLFAANAAGVRDRLLPANRASQIHSIAVLPLANLSGDSSQDYFADGMTDELITALAKNRNLRVVSRTSAMQYKGVNARSAISPANSGSMASSKVPSNELPTACT